MTMDRVGRAELGGYVAAVAGAGALVTFGLFSSYGQPFGTLNDIFLLVMTLAIAPMMLGSYELGGMTPLWPARFSLASGVAAVLVWSAAQVLMVAGVVTFADEQPATGVLAVEAVEAVEAVALIVIGAWLTGAPLLAGPWLPGPLRWLGALSGLGFVVFGLGLLRGGVNDPLSYVGGIGYQILFPIWAFLFARLLGLRNRPA
jgi:hypothetical protein